MSDELKPCPFCGSDNVISHKVYKDFYVKCGECEATGSLACNQEEAIKAWNTRHEPHPQENAGWEKEFDERFPELEKPERDKFDNLTGNRIVDLQIEVKSFIRSYIRPTLTEEEISECIENTWIEINSFNDGRLSKNICNTLAQALSKAMRGER